MELGERRSVRARASRRATWRLAAGEITVDDYRQIQTTIATAARPATPAGRTHTSMNFGGTNMTLTQSNFPRTARSLVLAITISLALAAPALASVTSEQQQGAQALIAVKAGTLNRTSLSSTQYEHVGEYLMGQALGSTQAHETMNALMDQMMGSVATDQMHAYLGERYLGKTTQPSGRYAPMLSLMGMMGSYRGSRFATMMGGYLPGQNNGNGGYVTGSGMMGYRYSGPSSSSGGWPTSAIILTVALAAALGVGALALGRARLGMRRRGNAPTAA